MTAIYDTIVQTKGSGPEMKLKNTSFKNGKEDLELNLEEVKHIIIEMDINLDNEDIKNIFSKLDTNNKGKIRKNSLIEYFKGNNKKQSIKIEEFFLSNSEKAIKKLKRLQQKFEKMTDQESISDIKWIINVIVTNSWENPDIDKNDEDGVGNEHDALKQYSHVQNTMNKRKDITTIKSNKEINLSVENKNRNRDNISEISGNTGTIIIPEDKIFNRRNTHFAR
jgi:hypothetical protein